MDPKWWCESKASKLLGHHPKKTPLSKDLWAKELSDERSLIVPWRKHQGYRVESLMTILMVKNGDDWNWVPKFSFLVDMIVTKEIISWILGLKSRTSW